MHRSSNRDSQQLSRSSKRQSLAQNQTAHQREQYLSKKILTQDHLATTFHLFPPKIKSDSQEVLITTSRKGATNDSKSFKISPQAWFYAHRIAGGYWTHHDSDCLTASGCISGS
ncbi:hypothetical protein FGO68_gene10115 [Halteria grandinella]|uniref:Uncharacterized protein n=1 Tax=Halteria grandinella TaxID=5974 RepID=A0A8J8NAB5_HALGN|nr:hypothetical protein FGO68_gene10115 [Halteria grandinella]